MYHTQTCEIVIDGAPEDIWAFSADPANWTASNPREHWGLSYDNPDNWPEEGVEFHQDEAVAGIRNDLYGRIQYLDEPTVTVWTGTAYYPLLGGLITLRIPEGGTIKLEPIDNDRTRMSHAVFMDFPNSRIGRWFKWVFEHVIDGPEKLRAHTQVELKYFKTAIEAGPGQAEAGARSLCEKPIS